MKPTIASLLRAIAAGVVTFAVSFIMLKIVVEISTILIRRQWYEDAFAVAFSVAVAVIVGRLTFRPEGINRVARFYWVLLVPACLLALGYSFFGYMGVGWSGYWRYGLMAMLVFPLFLFAFISLKFGVRLLWLYVAGMFVLHAVNGYQFPLKPNRMLVTVVILTHVAYMLKKRRQHVQREAASAEGGHSD